MHSNAVTKIRAKLAISLFYILNLVNLVLQDFLNQYKQIHYTLHYTVMAALSKPGY